MSATSFLTELRHSRLLPDDVMEQVSRQMACGDEKQASRELVESGKMTDRQFHDAVLRESSIPIEMIRADLTGQKLDRDFVTAWRFYEVEGREEKAGGQ